MIRYQASQNEMPSNIRRFKTVLLINLKKNMDAMKNVLTLVYGGDKYQQKPVLLLWLQCRTCTLCG